MKVKGLSDQLSEEQRVALAVTIRGNPRYQITVGKIYVVLSISLIDNSIYFGHSPIFHVVDDAGRLVPVPSCLFEIVDGRVSQHWEARAGGHFGLRLWPPEFYSEYFHDELSEGNEATVAIFRKVYEKIRAEFKD